MTGRFQIAPFQIPYSSTLDVILLNENYVFNTAQILSDITPFELTRTKLTGATTQRDGNLLRFRASDIRFDALTGADDAQFVLIATDSIPIFVFDITTIELVDVQILIKWNTDGVAEQVFVLSHRDYVIEQAQLNPDIDPDATTDLITSNSNLLDKALYLCNFMQFEAGTIYTVNPRSQFYELFEADVTADSGAIIDFQSTERLVADSIYTQSLYSCDFMAFKAGTIYTAQPPYATPLDATGEYIFPFELYRPNLIVQRDSNYLGASIDIADLDVPSTYKLKIFRADDTYGDDADYSELTTVNVSSLPYLDTGLDATLNYKYSAKFVIDGTIDSVPIEIISNRAKTRPSIGINQRI
jgi:hypothetical protein